MDDKSQNSYRKSLEQILEAVKYGYTKFIQTKRSVVIIGDTGQGKSTLLNFIAGNALEAYKSNYFSVLKLRIPLPPGDNKEASKPPGDNKEASKSLGDVKIGCGLSSMTKFPNKWVEAQGITYWDCPGFNDTNGFEQDVINAFYLNRIFDVSDQVNLVIVISEANIQVRADKLLTILQTLENLFVNLENITDFISLVLTKTKMEGPELLKGFLMDEFLPTQQKKLSSGQKRLIKSFASENGKVEVFPSPQKVGPIDKQSNQAIKKMLSSIKFVQKSKNQITVSQASLNKLQKIGHLINEDIGSLCKRVNDALETICFQVIEKMKSYELVNEWLKKTRISINQIKKVNQTQEFIPAFTKLCKDQNLDMSLSQNLIGTLTLLAFIQSIKVSVKSNIADWAKQFSISSLLDKLLEEPKVSLSSDKSTLTIASPLIGVNKIKQLIAEKGESSFNFVVIFCFHTLYIDEDLSYPGISFYIIAKNWKINDTRKISLKGLDAKHYETSANSHNVQDYEGIGISGNDGQPGIPGQTGGIFYGKITSKPIIFGPGTLLIDVRGGNGGNGQDGGNGAMGKGGQKASKQRVLAKDKSLLISRDKYDWKKKSDSQKFNQVWKTIGTFNGQMIQTYLQYGTEGKPGGDGGKGGAGGLAGLSGLVKFQEVKCEIYQGNGITGENGKVGNPGAGGINGESYQGIYINESMFTLLRDKGKIIQEEVEQQPINEKLDILTQSKVNSGQAIHGLTKALILAGNITAAIVKPALMTGATGIATLGILPIAQLAASGLSACLSSGWQQTQHIHNGQAPNGNVPSELNIQHQQSPTAAFEINDLYTQKLNEQFNEARQKFFNSLN